MAVNAGPLTTVFTPPASCTAVITLGVPPAYATGESLFIGHWASYKPASSACYPSSVTQFDFWTQNYYWSPGVCPQGYSTACSFTGVTLAAANSVSLCCPSGYQCHSVWAHVCQSYAARTLTNVFPITDDAQTLPANPVLETVTVSPGDFVYGDGVPVAWAATDADIMALLGSQTTSTTSKPSVPTQTGQTSQASQGSAITTSAATTTGQTATRPTTPQWSGSGPILTTDCGSPEWTLIDLATAYLWAPVVGCALDKQDCCPYALTPTTATIAPEDTARQSTAAGPSSTGTLLARCPDDYQTVGGTGCCPSGFPPSATPLGATLACETLLAAPTTAPPIPQSILSSVQPNEGLPTTKPISTAVGSVYALQFALQGPQSGTTGGLTTAQEAGIGVGSGVGFIIVAGLAAYLLVSLRRRKARRNQEASVLYSGPGALGGAGHVHPGTARQMSELESGTGGAGGVRAAAAAGARPETAEEMPTTPRDGPGMVELSPVPSAQASPLRRDFAEMQALARARAEEDERKSRQLQQYQERAGPHELP